MNVQYMDLTAGDKYADEFGNTWEVVRQYHLEGVVEVKHVLSGRNRFYNDHHFFGAGALRRVHDQPRHVCDCLAGLKVDLLIERLEELTEAQRKWVEDIRFLHSI